MGKFNQEEYEMPETPVVNLGEKEIQKETVVGKTREQMEAEIQEAKLFFENIDNISHKNDFKGETFYIEKYKEFKKDLENQDINKELEFKIYFQNIKNFIEDCEKALDIIAKKGEKYNPGESPTPEELSEKADEVSKRKTILGRHLYDLKTWIMDIKE